MRLRLAFQDAWGFALSILVLAVTMAILGGVVFAIVYAVSLGWHLGGRCG